MSRWRKSHLVVLPLMATLVAVSFGVSGSTASAGGEQVRAADPASSLELHAVSALSPTDAWAVGYENYKAVATHWDGTRWSRSAIPPSNWDSLTDVEAVAPDDVWAVGWHTTFTSTEAFILHWDGSTWQEVDSPPLAYSQPEAVSVVSADDVWAVGDYDDWSDGMKRCLIEHWNGVDWQVVDCPHDGFPDGAELYTVDMRSANDGWAAGTYTSHGRVPLTEHWNGRVWKQAKLQTPKGQGIHSMFAVAALGPSNALALMGGFSGDYVQRWDGSRWKTEGPQLDMHTYAMSAASPTDIWAAGGNPYHGGIVWAPAVEHFDGTAWTLTRIAAPQDRGWLVAVDAESPTDVWAVGNGFAEHWNGERWQYQVVP